VRTIAVLNHSTLVPPEDAGLCVTALQAQVTRDFAPTWGIGARLRLAEDPAEDEETLALLDDAAQATALGYQGRAAGGRPSGFVFVRPALDTVGSWQVAASHALLEMLADPLVNLAAEGAYQGTPALFALEVCDPVAGDEYDLAGVPVSNFVLPTWFLPGPLPDEALVDFLGRLTDPFTLSPGGYASYCTEPGRWHYWFAKRCPKHRRQPALFSRRQRRVQRRAGVTG
jgi:hypothetical protein